MPLYVRLAASPYGGAKHEDLQQADPEEARCPEASYLQQPLSITLVADVARAWRRKLPGSGRYQARKYVVSLLWRASPT